MSEADETRVMPCLGRPFYLGMLYDCRTDNLVPGVTLWDEDTIDKALDRRHKRTNSFSIITEDTVHNKASSLNVEAGLSLSAMGGLIEVSGSAKYMNDNRTSSRQARVTMHYSMTSEFKQLTMGALATKNIQHGDIFDKDVATHVVTGVELGVQAFFVFNQEVSTSESVEDISGKMHVLIKKIPSIVIEGNGSLNINKEEKDTADKLQCTFIGDVHLENLPVTFEEAVYAYQHLPEKIKGAMKPGEYLINVVPQTVWLYPLYKLDSTAAKFVRQIGNTLVTQVENIVQDLLEAEMKAAALLQIEACQYFLGINQQLERFAQLVSVHKADIMKKIVGLLPLIRGGKATEQALVAVLAEHNQSAFFHSSLTSWLRDKEQEIDILEAYLGPLSRSKAIKLALTPGDLDKEILRIDINSVFCFMFSIPQNSDPNGTLEKMAAQVDMGGKDDPKPPKSKFWYQDRNVISDMRNKVRVFVNLAEATNEDEERMVFIVSLTEPETPEDTGAKILQYTNGQPVSFDVPKQPTTPAVTNRQHNFIEVYWHKLEAKAGYKYTKVLYQAKDDEPNDWKTKSVVHSVVNQDIVYTFLTGLTPYTTYYFKVRAQYDGTGVSLDSDRSGPTMTEKDVVKLQLQNADSTIKEFSREVRQYFSRYIWGYDDNKQILRYVSPDAQHPHHGWEIVEGNRVIGRSHNGPDVPYNADWSPGAVVMVMLATKDKKDEKWIPLNELYDD